MMQNRKLMIFLAGSSVVVICTVTSLFYELPSWLLPGVTFLMTLSVAAGWGQTGRRLAIFLLTVVLAGFLGRELAGWQYLLVHGVNLPYSNEAVDRRFREQSHTEEIGTWLGVSLGVVIVLASIWPQWRGKVSQWD